MQMDILPFKKAYFRPLKAFLAARDFVFCFHLFWTALTVLINYSAPCYNSRDFLREIENG